MKQVILLVLLLISCTVFGQFAGPAGTIGSTAMFRDTSDFVAWGTGCTVERGLIDIANEFAGVATFGLDTDGEGSANGTVVSLGDSGIAIITFDQGIMNGPGPDFAVFENGFSDYFLELAFVEVSTDGINYVRFPATSFANDSIQIGPFDLGSEPEKINNLAGKYRASYGTPFDLDELIDSTQIDINDINYVKLVDVIGSIDAYASFDQYGNPINDPFATPFASGGFDLDAVGIIHQAPVGLNELSNHFVAFPNPVEVDQEVTIKSVVPIEGWSIYAIDGTLVAKGIEKQVPTNAIHRGNYLLQITTHSGIETLRITVQ